MSQKQPLSQKALLAWRQELASRRDSMIKDKQFNLRYRMFQKLQEMFGSDYPMEMEGLHAQDDLVLGAVVDGLNFLAFRDSHGYINIVLLVLCPQCKHQIMSDPLTHLAELGRELLQLQMKGTIDDHECPGASLNSPEFPPKDK